jgi:RNAse (barnase) inhibitor barstar
MNSIFSFLNSKLQRFVSIAFIGSLLVLLGIIAGCSNLLDESTVNNHYVSEINEGAQSSNATAQQPDIESEPEDEANPTSFAEVSAYIREHGELPNNFITKKQAEALGWVAAKGNLHEVAIGKSIGGDRFGNREGLLPDQQGRKWFEADINYDGGRRNADRIVYSNDGLIYMTTDHYKSFTDITDALMVLSTVTLRQSELALYPSVHHWLAEQLTFPDYYGHNLDALWDCLTGELPLPLHIVWLNDCDQTNSPANEHTNGLTKRSTSDYSNFISILEEAAEEVDGLSFQYMDRSSANQ